MSEDSTTRYEADTEDFRSFLSNQQSEFHHLKTQATRIIQTTLAFFALVGSFISLRALFSVQLPSPTATLPKEFFTDCLPNAISFQQDPTLHLGTFNSVLAGLLIILGIWLLVESLFGAVRTLMIPGMRPYREEGISFNEYEAWIQENQQRIRKAESLLRTSSWKMVHAGLAISTGLLLWGLSYSGLATQLAILNILAPIVLLLYILLSLREYLERFWHATENLVYRDDYIYQMLTWRVSPITVIGLIFIFGMALEFSIKLAGLFVSVCM